MTARETDAIRVRGHHLCGLTALDGLLWYSDGALDEIIAVDPTSGDEVGSVPCAGVRTGLTAAAGGTRLVQVVGGDKRLRALDPATGQVLEEYPNPRPGGELCGLHETPEGLWTGYSHPPVVELRRPADPDPLLSFDVGQNVADLTVMGDLVVFANHPAACLNVLEPRAARIVDVIPLTGNPTGLTWDGERLWYCDHASRHLRAVELSEADVGTTA